MKKILTFLFIFYIAIYYATQTVEAHILKTNGSIGAVLHISPEDDPVAGGVSYLFFEFKDKIGKFNLKACDCTLSVYANNKLIHSESLPQKNSDSSATSATVAYTFPEKNVYIIEVSGKPQEPNAFQSFTLSYDIRVETSVAPATRAAQDTNNDHVIHSVIFFAAFAIFIIWHTVVTVHKSGKKKTSTKTLILILIPLYSFMILGHIFHASHLRAEKKAADYSCCTLAVSETAHSFNWSRDSHYRSTIVEKKSIEIFVVLKTLHRNRSPTVTT